MLASRRPCLSEQSRRKAHVNVLCARTRRGESQAFIEVDCRIDFQHAQRERKMSALRFTHEATQDLRADATALKIRKNVYLVQMDAGGGPLDTQSAHGGIAELDDLCETCEDVLHGAIARFDLAPGAPSRARVGRHGFALDAEDKGGIFASGSTQLNFHALQRLRQAAAMRVTAEPGRFGFFMTSELGDMARGTVTRPLAHGKANADRRRDGRWQKKPQLFNREAGPRQEQHHHTAADREYCNA